MQTLSARTLASEQSVLFGRRVACIAVAIASVGCHTIQTYPVSSPKGGIPYYLPRSETAVELTIQRDAAGTFQSLSFEQTAKLVPDTNHVYYVHPRHYATFESEHHVKIRNGLLSSVEAVDTGRGGDIAVNVLNSAINLYKASQGIPIVQSDAMQDPFLTDMSWPTREEVRQLLGEIDGTSFSFTYAGATTRPIPGAGGSFSLDARHTLPPAPPIRPAAPRGPEPGLYTRLLQPAQGRIELRLDGTALLRRRIDAIDAALTANRDRHARLTRSRADQRQIEAEACKHAPAFERRLGQVDEDLRSLAKLRLHSQTSSAPGIQGGVEDLRRESQTLSTKLEACHSARVELRRRDTARWTADREEIELNRLLVKNNTYLNNCSAGWTLRICNANHVVAANDSILMLADANAVYRLPIRASALGKSRNSVRFADGIVTEYHTVRPSTAYEASNSLLTLTERIAALPSELLQLKIDLTGGQTKLAEAESALRDAQRALSDESQRQKQLSHELALLKAETELRVERARQEGQLGSIADVTRVAELTSEREVLSTEQSVAAARALLDAEERKLSTTANEAATLSQQVELAKQRKALADQIAQLPVTTPGSEAHAREAAELRAEAALLKQRKEVFQLRNEIRDLEREIDALERDAAE